MLTVKLLSQLRSERTLFSRKGFPSQLRLCSTRQNVERNYGDKDREAFDRAYPELKKCFIDIVKKYDNTTLPDWMEKCADYNLPHAPLARGQILVLAYKLLAPESQLDPQSIKIAQNVGWCLEMQEMSIIFSDDKIDNTAMRHGHPAWHKVNGVDDQSTNDAFVLDYASFTCLEHFIGHKDYYSKSVKRLRDSVLSAYLGQSLDLLSARSCITSFTMETYMNIVKLKAGEYAYYLPVAFALDMCGYQDEAMHKEASTILCEISFHNQVRDDYFDCFGEWHQRGTDIAENKLTWLAVNAIKMADKSQVEILKTCYGHNDPEKVEQVRDVYKALQFDAFQKEYEKTYYDKVTQMINNSPYDHIKPVYRSIFNKFFNNFKIG